MRFICKIVRSEWDNFGASDIRRYTLSLIKEAFIRSGEDGRDFYEICYRDNKLKPFTFSTYLPFNKKTDAEDNYIQLIFSTNNYEFLMRVYNGLLTISRDPDKIPLLKVKRIKDFFLSPEQRFDKSEIVFKTVSPFLVRDKSNGEYYVYPENAVLESKNKDVNKWKYWKVVSEEEFINTHLLTSLRALVEREMGDNSAEIEIKMNNLRVVPILHASKNVAHEFKITYPGIKAIIDIKARPEILKLFYDLGIGARRSEGFGLVEVVRGE